MVNLCKYRVLSMAGLSTSVHRIIKLSLLLLPQVPGFQDETLIKRSWCTLIFNSRGFTLNNCVF